MMSSTSRFQFVTPARTLCYYEGITEEQIAENNNEYAEFGLYRDQVVTLLNAYLPHRNSLTLIVLDYLYYGNLVTLNARHSHLSFSITSRSSNERMEKPAYPDTDNDKVKYDLFEQALIKVSYPLVCGAGGTNKGGLTSQALYMEKLPLTTPQLDAIRSNLYAKYNRKKENRVVEYLKEMGVIEINNSRCEIERSHHAIWNLIFAYAAESENIDRFESINTISSWVSVGQPLMKQAPYIPPQASFPFAIYCAIVPPSGSEIIPWVILDSDYIFACHWSETTASIQFKPQFFRVRHMTNDQPSPDDFEKEIHYPFEASGENEMVGFLLAPLSCEACATKGHSHDNCSEYSRPHDWQFIFINFMKSENEEPTVADFARASDRCATMLERLQPAVKQLASSAPALPPPSTSITG